MSLLSLHDLVDLALQVAKIADYTYVYISIYASMCIYIYIYIHTYVYISADPSGWQGERAGEELSNDPGPSFRAPLFCCGEGAVSELVFLSAR